MAIAADRFTRAAAFAAAFCMAGVPASGLACVEGGHRGEIVTLERASGETPEGGNVVMQIIGGGWFHAAEVVKQGGSSDRTVVTLELDGEPMLSTSFAALRHNWRGVDSQYMVLKLHTEGDTSTITVWYQRELKFRTSAVLRVDVEEEGVDKLRVRTVMNKPAPHENVPDTQQLALPAFE